MARRRQESFFDTLVYLPWPFAVSFGLIAFVGIKWGLAWYFGSVDSPQTKAMAAMFAKGTLDPLAWMFLLMGCMAAGFSWYRGRDRARLLEQQTGIDSLKAMSWARFEQLVGEAYRRLGYQIVETGQGGADGGIDLLLRKGGQTTLVQCKQWRTQKIGIAVVREMFGLMTHHGADAVKIVCTGTFSSECEAFCRDKPIELVDGPALLRLVQAVQSNPGVSSSGQRSEQATPASSVAAPEPSPSPTSSEAPSCPRCGSGMARRTNRSTGLPFWGCSTYPKCKGTLPG